MHIRTYNKNKYKFKYLTIYIIIISIELELEIDIIASSQINKHNPNQAYKLNNITLYQSHSFTHVEIYGPLAEYPLQLPVHQQPVHLHLHCLQRRRLRTAKVTHTY